MVSDHVVALGEGSHLVLVDLGQCLVQFNKAFAEVCGNVDAVNFFEREAALVFLLFYEAFLALLELGLANVPGTEVKELVTQMPLFKDGGDWTTVKLLRVEE